MRAVSQTSLASNVTADTCGSDDSFRKASASSQRAAAGLNTLKEALNEMLMIAGEL